MVEPWTFYYLLRYYIHDNRSPWGTDDHYQTKHLTIFTYIYPNSLMAHVTCLIEIVHPLEGLLMCNPRLLSTLFLFLPHKYSPTCNREFWCVLFRTALLISVWIPFHCRGHSSKSGTGLNEHVVFSTLNGAHHVNVTDWP